MLNSDAAQQRGRCTVRVSDGRGIARVPPGTIARREEVAGPQEQNRIHSTTRRPTEITPRKRIVSEVRTFGTQATSTSPDWVCHRVPHIQGVFYLKSLTLETLGKSLHHSCRTEFTRQGILLPLDRQITAVCCKKKCCIHPLGTFVPGPAHYKMCRCRKQQLPVPGLRRRLSTVGAVSLANEIMRPGMHWNIQ